MTFTFTITFTLAFTFTFTLPYLTLPSPPRSRIASTPPRLPLVLGAKMKTIWLKDQLKKRSKSATKIFQKSTQNYPKSTPKQSKIGVWRKSERLLKLIEACWSCLGASWGPPGRLGCVLGVLGPSEKASWARLGAPWGCLGEVRSVH